MFIDLFFYSGKSWYGKKVAIFKYENVLPFKLPQAMFNF